VRVFVSHAGRDRAWAEWVACPGGGRKRRRVPTQAVRLPRRPDRRIVVCAD